MKLGGKVRRARGPESEKNAWLLMQMRSKSICKNLPSSGRPRVTVGLMVADSLTTGEQSIAGGEELSALVGVKLARGVAEVEHG